MSVVPHSQLATKLTLTMVAKYTPISEPKRFGFDLGGGSAIVKTGQFETGVLLCFLRDGAF